MYKINIEFNSNLSVKMLDELKKFVSKAYRNRAGVMYDECQDNNRCVFAGNEDLFCCIGLGNFEISKNEKVCNYITKWDWIDEEFPEENHSILEVVKKRKKEAISR